MNEETLRHDLVSLAKEALSGRRDLIEIVRDMYPLLNRLPEYEDDLFDDIVAFYSEMDGVPTGDARAKYDESYLKRIDETAAPYIAQMKPNILSACSQIVTRYEISA